MRIPPSLVLVDDSEDLRLAVRINFKRHAHFHIVGEGSSGHDAIALATEYTPDAMLLDVSMPGMDGLEALPRIIASSPNTKVIMFTGFVQHGLKERVQQMGAIALIEKSYSLRGLPAEVERLLSNDVPSIRIPGTPQKVVEPSDSIADEQLERFREVFEEAAIGMGTMTLAGHLVRANKSFAELAQVTSDALVGNKFEDLVPSANRDEFRTLLIKAIARESGGEGLYQMEHKLPTTDDDRWVRTTLAPVRDSRGAALYLFVQMQEVTENRRITAALRRSEAQFESVVRSVDNAIAVLDLDGFVQSWNPGAERMTGYSAEDVVGQHFGMLYSPSERKEKYPQNFLKRVLRDGRAEEEGPRERTNGERFWASDVTTAIFDPDGSPTGFARISQDTSDRRKRWIEQEVAGNALGRENVELRAQNVGLAQTAEDQSQFLAMTAHELRTPVATIGDLAQSLRDDDYNPAERVGVLDAMISSSGRLQRLLEDLLTAARLDAQAISLDRSPTSLGAALRQSVKNAGRRYPDTSITISETAEDDVVSADSERLGQIIDNLINNAVNHGDPPVSVSIEAMDDAIELRVSDTGGGVPMGLRDRLFDRYVTAARSGTGLGLYIVRELARAHGGDAWYEGDGLVPTFVVSLPRHSPDLSD